MIKLFSLQHLNNKTPAQAFTWATRDLRNLHISVQLMKSSNHEAM